MKTEKIDFKEIKAEDLDGNTIVLPETFAKDLGNRLYASAPNIDVADLGRKLHASFKDKTELLLDKDELALLNQMFDAVRLLGYPAHLSTKKYLENKLKSLDVN